MSGELAFRLRQYTPDGERGKILPYSAFSADFLHADISTVTRLAFTELIVEPAFPLVAAVEASTSGQWAEWGRFVFTGREGDESDASKFRTFRGVEYLPWLLQRLRIRGGGEDGTREWKDKTVGDILTDLITEGQARGWAPDVTLGFTRTHDSDGQPWPTFRRSFVERMPVMQALGKLVKTGRCEWRADGMTLNLFLPGSGADRTADPGVVRLRGQSGQPFKESWDNIYTTLGVSLDEGVTVDLPNPDAPTLFGTLEGWVEQSGVDEDEAEASTSEYLAAAAAPQREVTVTVDAGQGAALPGVDYELGDWVLVNEGAGWVGRRVVSVTVDATPDGKSTLATATGARFRDLLYRMARAQSEANAGSAVLGDGTTPTPPPPTIETRIPAVPGNFTVGSSSWWQADGTATAALTAAWDAVSEDVDGAPLTVDLYRVLTRLSGDAASEIVAASVPGTAATLKGFTPEVQYEVAVQCRSAAGSWSALTEWVPVTALAPSSGQAAPDTPTAVSMLGLVVATWNGMLGGLPPEYHFDHTRWETSTDDGDTWQDAGQPARRGGDTTFRGFELGQTVHLRLVAVAVDGTESDPSEPAAVVVKGSDAAAVIEAGTIVANLVQAGALTVNELAPSVGDELTMTAAGGVAIRISDMVNDQRQRYDFGPSGLVITEPGSLLSVTLSSSEIAMMQGAQKVSWWEAQILNVPQIAVDGGRVVNHTVSDDGAGGTVWMVA